MSEHVFHIKGMHCASCVVLIEDKIREHGGVSHVSVSLSTRQAVVRGDFEQDKEALAQRFTALVKEHGYEISHQEFASERKWHEFLYAAPIAFVVIVGFVLLQKLGFIDLIGSGGASYGTAVVIGLIASVSTCLAVVGGLVLSLSANYAKGGARWRPQMLFHVGRLVGFFILGGVIGMLGQSFALGITGSIVLGALVALVMLVLGINLLDVLHITKRLQITMPKVVSRYLLGGRAATTIGPLLIGAATFFLPCGFTQAMQVYTLSTGGFVPGGLTMLLFALGTLPVLALLSAGAQSIAQKSWKGTFFKTAGLVVIALALFNGINTLVVAGVIDPVFNF